MREGGLSGKLSEGGVGYKENKVRESGLSGKLSEGGVGYQEN